MSADTMYKRYFMFSREHQEQIKRTAKKNGNLNPKFGSVLVNGSFKKYTTITTKPDNYSSRYGDARVVISGDIRKIRYTESEGI